MNTTITKRAAQSMCAVLLGALLVGCPNELSLQISEDVLVANAGGRPQVVSNTPTPDQTGVLSTVAIEVIFDMDIDPETIANAISLYREPDRSTPIAGTAEYRPDTRTVVFTPSERLPVDAEFRVQLDTEIRNTGGATLNETVGWNFTTTDVNPDEIRIDLTTALTPAVAAGSPLYLTMLPFPIDPTRARLFGPYEIGTQSIILNQSELTTDVNQTGFVALFAHDQDNDFVDVENPGTSDPSWFFLDGANGNVWPDLYNGISEFNALNPSVEANPDLALELGTRYTVHIAASGADDHSRYASVNEAEFLDGPFTTIDAAFNSPVERTAASRYHSEWFEFTVPAGGTNQYEIVTAKVSDPVEVYHELTLYEFTGGEPVELQSAASAWTSSDPPGGTPFATLDTSSASTAYDLVAGTTYYLSVYTFWIQAFSTSIPSGSYTISITPVP